MGRKSGRGGVDGYRRDSRDLEERSAVEKQRVPSKWTKVAHATDDTSAQLGASLAAQLAGVAQLVKSAAAGPELEAGRGNDCTARRLDC